MPFIKLSSHDLHYLQLGGGDDGADVEDVVMVHGLAANMAFWYAGLAPVLAPRYRVTIFDLRGHGASGTPERGYTAGELSQDLLALLDHLGIARCHLVAHSFGGMVAITLALAHPERISSLVLADVRIHAVQPQLKIRAFGGIPRWRKLLGEMGIDFDDEHPESGLLLLGLIARLQVERPELAARLRQAFMGTEGGFGNRAARKWLRLIETTSALKDFSATRTFAESDLARLEMPVFVIVGERSVTGPSAQALMAHCPRVRLQAISRAGHFFPLTRRRLFPRLVADFLQEVSAGSV